MPDAFDRYIIIWVKMKLQKKIYTWSTCCKTIIQTNIITI